MKKKKSKAGRPKGSKNKKVKVSRKKRSPNNKVLQEQDRRIGVFIQGVRNMDLPESTKKDILARTLLGD